MPSAFSYDQSTITSKVSDVFHVDTLVDRAAVGHKKEHTLRAYEGCWVWQ